MAVDWYEPHPLLPVHICLKKLYIYLENRSNLLLSHLTHYNLFKLIFVHIFNISWHECYNALTLKSLLRRSLSLKFRIGVPRNYNSCTLHDVSLNLFKNLEIRFEQFIEVWFLTLKVALTHFVKIFELAHYSTE
jgi:hypothetical protein